MLLKSIRHTLSGDFNYRTTSSISSLNFREDNGKTVIDYKYISFGNGLKLELIEKNTLFNFSFLSLNFSFFGDIDELIMNDQLFNDIITLNKTIYNYSEEIGLDGYIIELDNGKHYSKQELSLFNYISKMISSVKDNKKRLIFKNLISPKSYNFSTNSIITLNTNRYEYLELVNNNLLKIAEIFNHRPLLYNSDSMRRKDYIYESLVYNGEFHFYYKSAFFTCKVYVEKGTLTIESPQKSIDLNLCNTDCSTSVIQYLDLIKQENEMNSLLNEDFVFLKDFLKKEFLVFNFNTNYFSRIKNEILKHFESDEFEEGLRLNIYNKTVAFSKVFVNNSIQLCARQLIIGDKQLIFYEDLSLNSIEVSIKKR